MSAPIQDPKRQDRWIVGNAAVGNFGQQVGAAVLQRVHPPAHCAGEPCVFHNPSDHHMRDWPLNWRDDRGLIERLCPHGVGHPDPDGMAWHMRNGREWMGVHGCDSCCLDGQS